MFSLSFDARASYPFSVTPVSAKMTEFSGSAPRMGQRLLRMAPVLCLLFLGTGCAGGPGQTEDPVTIVFSHAKHPQAAYLREILDQFEAQNPHIRVREQILPSSSDEQHQFYVINLLGGSADLDVLDMDIIWVPEFSQAGWLADLTSRIPASALAPLHPAALQADWFQQKLYAVPWFVDTGVLYYRKDLLEKYGFSPPENYADLVRVASAILAGEQDPRLTGFLWQGMQYEGLVCTALEIIRGNGADILTGSGQPDLTNERVLDALRFMSDLIRRTKVSPALVTTLDEESARHTFQSGRAVFMRSWPYAWPLLQEAGSPVAGRVGMTIVPHFAGYRSAPTLGGFHLGINSRSRHPEEAATFIRYMISQAVQREVLLHLGVLPADTRLMAEADLQRQVPQLSVLTPILAQARPRPVTPYYLMISQILQPELSAVVSGIRSPQQAMRSADQQIEHLLGQE
jgi:trehalose/maltose transport system substrate-binding protein